MRRAARLSKLPPGARIQVRNGQGLAVLVQGLVDGLIEAVAGRMQRKTSRGSQRKVRPNNEEAGSFHRKRQHCVLSKNLQKTGQGE